MATRDKNPAAVITEDAPEGVQVREGEYGARVATVEPGGAEFIALHERHGRPLQLFWTWTSPNLEFATVFVGVLAVAAFGLSFWQAVLAIVVGQAAGSITQGILSARGPSHGVPQMVLSRLGFGYWGNAFPAGLNAVTAGIGWFAVNSVSGTFALNTLTHMPKPLCLLIIVVVQVVVAFFGHNLVQLFERYAFPVLAVIFVIATIVILAKSSPGAPSHGGGSGGFLLAAGTVFGYAAGWNPYAADYTRYFTPDTSEGDRTLVRTGAVPVLRDPGDRRRGLGHDHWRGRRPRRPHRRLHRPSAHGACRPHPAGHRARRGRGERAQHLLRRALLRRHGHQAATGAAPRHHSAGLRRDRLHPRPHRAARRRDQVRELPADHRLLDRAMAGRGLLRPVPAPPSAPRRDRGHALRPAAHRVGRPGGDGRGDGPVDLAVLQPDRVRRRGPQPRTGGRRPHLRGGLRRHRRDLPDLACDRRPAAGAGSVSGIDHPVRPGRRPPARPGTAVPPAGEKPGEDRGPGPDQLHSQGGLSRAGEWRAPGAPL